MFRRCVKDLLEGTGGLKVIGEAGDDLRLLDLFKKELPDMVIWGISMPNQQGLAATREIKSVYPNVKILILTMHREKEYVDYVLAAGAEGYLLKENADAEIFMAVEKVRQGERYVSPLVAGGSYAALK